MGIVAADFAIVRRDGPPYERADPVKLSALPELRTDMGQYLSANRKVC